MPPPARHVVAFRSALIVCSLALAATSTAFGAGAETDEEALAASYAAARQARHELIQRAVAVAAQGDATAAWKILSADAGREVTAETIGWRAATVAGFLRNQNADEAAAEFTRVALAQRWQDLPQPRGAEKRAEAAYWKAWLAAEILGRREEALGWLAEARALDVQSERIVALQARLKAAEAAFPRRAP